jgi:hypothetical protein
MRKIVLGLFALTLATPAALAQAPLTFAEVDIDANGLLSFTELQAVWPDLTQEEFAAADIEGKGELTPEQVSTLQPAAIPAPMPADNVDSAPAEPAESLAD